jgi:4-hydroxy-tetrahydrodipicolinate synthase
MMLRQCQRSFSTARASLFHGVFPIVVTPFCSDESLDLFSFGRSIEFLSKTGAAGVTVAGVLGEADRLTDTEREYLISKAKETVDGLSQPFHLVVGTSHPGTHAAVALTKTAARLGADAVMIAPHKDHSTDESIYHLYERVADACPDLPVILQDYPTSSGVHFSLDLLTRIVSEISTVQSIKLESLPTATRLSALRNIPEFVKSEVTVLTGLGGLNAGFDLEQGCDGFMTGFAFPEVLCAMNKYAQTNNMNKALELYQLYLPLLVMEQQGGLAIRKEIYRKRGMIECNHVRHPGKCIELVLKASLDRQLERSFPGIDITKTLSPDLFGLESW